MSQLFNRCIATTLLLSAVTAIAQERRIEDNSGLLNKLFKSKGKLSGSVYCDLAHKATADSLARGGNNQYVTMPANTNQLQLRRALLGYRYQINNKISAEVLLATENTWQYNLTKPAATPTDNNRLNTELRLANVRWGNIIDGGDLVAGKIYTPAFSGNAESMWGYRSVERTLSDRLGTPISATGVSLQGFLPFSDNIGYNFMIARSNQLTQSNQNWYFGNVFYKTLENKVTIDLYSDYTKLDQLAGLTHSRQMNKVMISYSVPRVTVGVEACYTQLKGDNIASRRNDVKSDTITTKSAGLSAFVRVKIYKRALSVFARYDYFTAGLNNNNGLYASYAAQNSYFNPNTANEFITAGLDITPVRGIKIIPNVWYTSYTNTGAQDYGSLNKGYDLVYRLTLACQLGR